jgi:hypothetical protein
MTYHSSRPSGGTGYSPFEQELVNAMNDLVNGAETPHFDTEAIARGARRKRATAIAGIAAALVVAGGGTALASGAVGDSHAERRAAVSAERDATLLYGYKTGGTVPVRLGGLEATEARALLFRKYKVKSEITKASAPGCKPGSVIAVSPHTPTVVYAGATVKVTLCAG